ncbi:MAG TPA: N(4)-(beta-N-acetylglucosaminyl)-L-asparaginase [Saprospiraceae bacterium]|nr:N(4)-(beta-N-acetylglucosaminyl)-L-asparaginase [Saprospiraceae bacterium]
MSNRRKFLKHSILGGVTAPFALWSCESVEDSSTKVLKTDQQVSLPVSIATWNNVGACNAAWDVLKANGNALDAVEAGVKIPEADPNDRSVGYGGRPDREGKVTLDACIMDKTGDCGSVVFLEDFMHPISVARKVMEETPHVILAGEGAHQFALEQGFEPQNLLIEESKKEWEEWLESSQYQPVINIENHDTIGMVTLDAQGDIAGACTTSGAAYKMRGRVGDSPIIGAGMFVDNEVGGAAATGLGEAVLKSLGSFLIVELMRQGMSPQAACEEAVMRIVRKQPEHTELQVGYLAVDKQGNYGGYSIQPGFVYYVQSADEGFLVKAPSYL